MNESNSLFSLTSSGNLEQKIWGYKSKVDDFIAGQLAEMDPELYSIINYILEGGKRGFRISHTLGTHLQGKG